MIVALEAATSTFICSTVKNDLYTKLNSVRHIHVHVHDKQSKAQLFLF